MSVEYVLMVETGLPPSACCPSANTKLANASNAIAKIDLDIRWFEKSGLYQ